MRDCQLLSSGRRRLQLSYAPQALPRSAAAKAAIAAAWDEALRGRSPDVPLFDGRLFSLREWHDDGAVLALALGDTGYRDYVGTRRAAFAQAFPTTPLANPLAVCSAVVTADQQVVVERRRFGDVYNHCYHVIGGFLDRDCDGLPPDPAAAVAREIGEELGCPLVGEGEGLGLVYDQRTPHPELCYLHHTPWTFAEVVAGANRAEVGELIPVPLVAEALSAFVRENEAVLSVTGGGCLELLLHTLCA